MKKKTNFEEYKEIAEKLSIICAFICVGCVILGLVFIFIELRVSMGCFMGLFLAALLGFGCDCYIQGGMDENSKK